MEKMAREGPKWGREDFFQLIQALPTVWAERILILRTFIFSIFWIPNFWIFRFPDFQNLAWAGLGPLARPGWGGRVGPWQFWPTL